MADAVADVEDGGLMRTLKDLFAGAAGGVAQVLLGMFKLSFLFVIEAMKVFLLVTCLSSNSLQHISKDPDRDLRAQGQVLDGRNLISLSLLIIWVYTKSSH
jgi:hypothetical protein